ncbi:RidA family protein [Pseudomonas sp. MBLB4123]|uniref:RidA family protein n=1 Tax=Pseudomonas sp. MBLB4123 TaxID=3451557 RepID=UPI003F74FAF4
MNISRYETSARMSRVVVHNHTAYLCGQVAEDRSAGIAEQTRTMLAKVDALLESVGSSREQILSATLYLKDMALFAEMNSVWDNWVPAGHAPARACVEASMASPELLVEISVIAAVSP